MKARAEEFRYLACLHEEAGVNVPDFLGAARHDYGACVRNRASGNSAAGLSRGQSKCRSRTPRLVLVRQRASDTTQQQADRVLDAGRGCRERPIMRGENAAFRR